MSKEYRLLHQHHFVTRVRCLPTASCQAKHQHYAYRPNETHSLPPGCEYYRSLRNRMLVPRQNTIVMHSLKKQPLKRPESWPVVLCLGLGPVISSGWSSLCADKVAVIRVRGVARPKLQSVTQRAVRSDGAGHRPAGSPQSLLPPAPAQGGLSERPWLKIGEFSNTNSNRNSFSGFVADVSLLARSR